MPRGGARPGGGRPRDPNSRRGRARAKAGIEDPPRKQAVVVLKASEPEHRSEPSARVVIGAKQPLEYMLDVMNDPETDPKRRDYMAVAAAPYVHGKASDLGKKHQKQEAAQKAVGGRFATPPVPGAPKAH